METGNALTNSTLNLRRWFCASTLFLSCVSYISVAIADSSTLSENDALSGEAVTPELNLKRTKEHHIVVFAGDPDYQQKLEQQNQAIAEFEREYEKKKAEKSSKANIQPSFDVIELDAPKQNLEPSNKTAQFIFENKTEMSLDEQTQNDVDAMRERKALVESLRQSASRKNK